MMQTSTSTTAAQNKAQLETAFAEAAAGSVARFRELYADDVHWTTIGTTAWSGTFAGKPAVEAMFGRLYPLIEGRIVVTPHRFIADNDVVAVEARGKAMTKTGKPYNNTYCLVFRFAAGKIAEVIEYSDTALINAAL